DFTPIALALSGLFFFIGIYWHRFLDIIPIARNIIVEEMDQGIIILDKSDLVIDINIAALKLFRIQKSVLGQPIQNIEKIWEVIKHSYNQKSSTFEALIKSEKGEMNCSITVKPISTEIQDQLGVLITINDITMLVNLYDEKMKLLSQMEETYVKLNSTQLQLIHKEKLASIGQIAAGMAHEIKNPLSFIQSNHRFLERYINDVYKVGNKTEELDEIKAEIDDILFDSKDGLKRILGVVNSLLDFSRNENERNLERNFDVNISLDEALKILKGNMNPSTKIKKEYGHLPEIVCYGSEINQVFLNLLNNAYHATGGDKNDQGLIIIRTSEADEYVVIEILNTGERISPEFRQKIFEPFYTTKASGKGTGLGLSIVSDIVIKRHNGKIEVLEENNMTMFRVYLKKEMDKSLISTGSLEFVLQET
ncbi:MAG: ATP-binding protein, partial [Spirochaetales bacterium]|nr:ATP-binding protein [Spirochaetales bacterium]